jgi:hypothetical protein
MMNSLVPQKENRFKQELNALLKSILERRAGIEPANTGFADLRVSRFATGA